MNMRLSTQSTNRGFSLIATLSIMFLLMVVLLGMIALTTTTQKESAMNRNMVEAQANARLALLMAVADLQKHTGPDQRVTANAEILGATDNRHWTGVWSTTQPTTPDQPLSKTNPPLPAKPVVTGAADPAHPDPDNVYLSDFRNTPGLNRQSLMLAWLVSGDLPADKLPIDAYSTKTPITLVEKAAGLDDASTPDPLGERITAPLVEINPGTNQAGGYAYWVGDESVKARVDLKSSEKQPSLSTPKDGGMARLSGAEAPNIRTVKAGTDQPYGPVQDASTSDHSKLVSTNTVALLMEDDDKNALKKNFHDFTVSSESVLADAREGGLKKDLTCYISKSGTAEIPIISGIPESGFTSIGGITGRSMFPGTIYGSYAPNFLQLRNWYDLRNKVSGNPGSSSMDPEFLPTRTSYRTYGPMPDIKKSAQALHPYVTDAMMAYDFSIDSTRGTTGMAVRLHVYPRVTLWNPHNVKIKATKYWMGFYKVVGGMASGTTQAQGIAGTNSSFYGNHLNGNSVMIYFLLDVAEMEPGECVILSPKASAESTKYDITNPENNVLTASTPSGGLENFYFDSNRQLPATVTDWQTNYYQLHTGEHRLYSFKSYQSPPDTAPNIQRFALNGNGEAGANYAGSPHGNWKTSETGRTLKPSASHLGTVPSRHWSSQARMQWMDECRSEIIGPYSGTVGHHPIRKPIIANFNIRPSVIHRDNFNAAFEQWYWNYGVFLDTRAEQKPLNDNAFRGLYNSGKSLGSPFGYPSDYSSVKSFTMFDVPHKDVPITSLASFQHAQLSYQAWHPTYIIGNSLCDPRCGSGADHRNPALPYLTRDITVNEAYYSLNYGPDRASTKAGGASNYKNAWDTNLDNDRQNVGRWDDLIQGPTATTALTGAMKEMLFYDASYMANHALWDRFFLSTLPHSSTGVAAWDGNSASLPFSKMKTSPYNNINAAGRKVLAEGSNGFDYMSYLLMNEGAFNINSTSLEAWRAFFSTLSDVERPTINGEKIVAAFSRVLIPTNNDPVGNHFSSGAWSGARKLTEAEIDLLATEMVKIVKTRGPFLGVSDFVNRRLLPIKGEFDASVELTEDKEGNIKNDPSLCGPLQAAIELAGINKTLQQDTISSPSLGTMTVAGGDWVARDARSGGWSFDNRAINPDFWAFAPWKTYGMPGYLTQADILQTTGGNITARGDTFLIRAYGDKRDASGKILARAWCEAVVQRTPDYLLSKPIHQSSDASGNNPLEPMAIRSTTNYSSTENPNIHPINKQYGRKYVVKSFRWLSPSEI